MKHTLRFLPLVLGLCLLVELLCLEYHSEIHFLVLNDVNDSPSGDDEFELPPVMLMFLTYKDLHQQDLWEQWYTEAKTDFEERLNVTLPLRAGAIHSKPNAHFPVWIKDFGMGSKDAHWGTPNASVLKLIQESLKFVTHTNAYFIIVSDTSVPVKPFIDIYIEIIADPRTRVSIWSTEYSGCMPKTASWFAFSRDHMERLVEVKNIWLHKGWGPHSESSQPPGVTRTSQRSRPPRKMPPHPPYAKKSAGQDEYYTFAALWISLMPPTLAKGYTQWLSSPKKLLRLVKNTTSEDGLVQDCRSEGILPRSIRATIANPPDFRSHHFVTWYELKEDVARPYIGGGKTSGAHPLAFSRINSGLVKFLRDKSQVWFVRKVDDKTHVQNCYHTEKDFFEDWIGISSHSRPSDTFATNWLETFSEPNQTIPYVDGVHRKGPKPNATIYDPEEERCSLQIYLTSLWSSAEDKAAFTHN